MSQNTKLHLGSYRTYLMGFAICCILFTHNTIQINTVWSVSKIIAQAGVDIFFFLSGYGLCNSYDKNPKGFYIRRFLRIIPTYLIVVVPYIIILFSFLSSSLKTVLWDFSLVSFFTDGILLEWFVAAIIFLYCVFPLLFSLAKKRAALFSFCIIIWGAVLLVSYGSIRVPNNIETVIKVFIVRIPIFLIGIYIKMYGIEFRRKCIVAFISVFVLSVLTIILIYSTIKDYWPLIRMAFCPLAISECYILTYFIDVSPSFIRNAFEKLGVITLELYLIHEKILILLTATISRILKIKIPEELMWTIVVNIIAVILSVPVSCGVSWSTKHLLHLFKSDTSPK